VNNNKECIEEYFNIKRGDKNADGDQDQRGGLSSDDEGGK